MTSALPPSRENPGQAIQEESDLDSLRFQDVVDDAKRILPSLYPQWTDHNVSDPGITLIEACAAEIDTLSYRLGRMPPQVLDAYLKLLARPLQPATAARALLTFTQTPGAPADPPVPVRLPAGTQVATGPGPEEGVVFTITSQYTLPAVPGYAYGRPNTIPSNPSGNGAYNVTSLDLDADLPVAPTDSPDQGKSLALLTDPGQGKLLTVHVSLTMQSASGEAEQPPCTLWEVLTSQGWQPVQWLYNGTSLRTPGPVPCTFTLPRTRTLASVQASLTGSKVGGQATFSAPGCVALRISAEGPPGSRWSIAYLAPAYAVAPAVPALQLTRVSKDVGRSDGTPGQTFPLPHFLAADKLDEARVVVTPSANGVPQTWTRTETFATATDETAHFMLDPATSRLRFGPQVTTHQGAMQYGRIPANDATVTIHDAAITQGARGNVAAHTLTHLVGTTWRQLDPVNPTRPLVEVTNTTSARSGSDPETVELLLENTNAGFHRPQRCVTADEYEHTLNSNLPGLARAICKPAPPAERSRYDLQAVLIPELPAGASPSALTLEASPALITTARDLLSTRRLLGARVLISSPASVPLHIAIDLTTDLPAQEHQRLRDLIRETLIAALHPVTGGPQHTGWALDKIPTAGELSAVLAHVPGIRASAPRITIRPPEGLGPQMPVVDVLDLTINQNRYWDSAVLAPQVTDPAQATDRSISLTIQAGLNTWSLTAPTPTGGRWLTPIPSTLTADTQPLVCQASVRDGAFTGSLTISLPGTGQWVELDWSNPPTGANTFTLTSSSDKLTATLSDGLQQISSSVTGQSRAKNLGAAGNSAHPQLTLTLTPGEALNRSLILDAADGSNDTWTAAKETNSLRNCSAEIKDLKASISCQNNNASMYGAVTYTCTVTKHFVTLNWEAAPLGNITYKASANSNAQAFLAGELITPQGITRTAGQEDGGRNATAKITLKDPLHQHVTVHLDNRLPSNLTRASLSAPTNALWKPEPPLIVTADTASFTTVATNQAQPFTGSATYAYTLNSDTTGQLTLTWTRNKDNITITLTVPTQATVKAGSSWS
ncbi:Baseplate J-like protein (plasmid) [Streptomyces sp. YIM 121038]|uniref:baseplate J/gp47 family protein n=1 Tax=Streptomyces sp. YIM 121038 TaxID=2136401 RepID=UPI0011100876|nr:baseplate J/gp47 family protein [Streptomyces sp. YIM 121038]QCX82328.1 Baseplate J-like protein [Streptomyces sp. YIM 121038]